MLCPELHRSCHNTISVDENIIMHDTPEASCGGIFQMWNWLLRKIVLVPDHCIRSQAFHFSLQDTLKVFFLLDLDAEVIDEIV